jgi:hypothetical protein
MLADGKLIVLNEKGTLMIGDASPKQFRPVLKAKIIKGKCFTGPVFSGGKIYTRNISGDLTCVALNQTKSEKKAVLQPELTVFVPFSVKCWQSKEAVQRFILTITAPRPSSRSGCLLNIEKSLKETLPLYCQGPYLDRKRKEKKDVVGRSL